MPRSSRRLAVPLVLACIVAAARAQDVIQLTDGRFVQGPVMTRTPDGVKVHFKNGDVLVRKDLVRDACVSKTEGLPADKPPPDAAEKEAMGFVRFEGKWLKKEQRDKLLDDRQKARAKAIKEVMDHREWRNRYKQQTPNFDFEYTIDKEVMKDFSALMEEYYKVFTKEWKITKPANMGRLKVCFYHDAETYYQVSGAQRGVIGWFRFVKPIELNFYYDRNDYDLTVLVMFHETNHYLTHLIDPEFQYPLWINESLAEYYGASHWDPVKKQMSVGFLQDGRLTVIQDQIANDKWQDLDQLMRLPHAEFTPDHYAWGWSFVHYLLENKKYAQKFKSFYLALAREKSLKTINTPEFGLGGPKRTIGPDETIKTLVQYLGVKDLKTLETEWHDYVKGLSPTSARGFAEAGRLYAFHGMPIKARRFYETAIAKGDTRAVVYYGLGQVLEAKAEYEKAEEAFRNAIDRDPMNGVYYAMLSRAIRNRTHDPKNADADRLNALALEVDPDNMQLIQMLAFDEAAFKALADVFKAESKPAPESKPGQ
jgi:tetratricopeptide (TPR) repeat protein